MWKGKDSLDKGSGGFTSLYKDNRKNVLQSPQNYKCQKCLQIGHFTYECKGERKYVSRDSRTQILKRKIEEKTDSGGKKKRNEGGKSDSDSSSSSDSSSDSGSESSSDSNSSSDSSSESSSSDEERSIKKKKKAKKEKKNYDCIDYIQLQRMSEDEPMNIVLRTSFSRDRKARALNSPGNHHRPQDSEDENEGQDFRSRSKNTNDAGFSNEDNRANQRYSSGSSHQASGSGYKSEKHKRRHSKTRDSEDEDTDDRKYKDDYGDYLERKRSEDNAYSKTGQYGGRGCGTQKSSRDEEEREDSKRETKSSQGKENGRGGFQVAELEASDCELESGAGPLKGKRSCVETEDKKDIPEHQSNRGFVQESKSGKSDREDKFLSSEEDNLGDDASSKSVNNSGGSKYNDKYLTIKVIRVLQELETAEIHFRVKHTTQLGKLKKSYSERVGVPLYLLRFLYDGKRIIDEHTPEVLEMESGDVIEVYDEMGSTSCGNPTVGNLQQRRRQLSTSSSASSTSTHNIREDVTKLCAPKQDDDDDYEYNDSICDQSFQHKYSQSGMASIAGPSTSNNVPAFLPVTVCGASGTMIRMSSLNGSLDNVPGGECSTKSRGRSGGSARSKKRPWSDHDSQEEKICIDGDVVKLAKRRVRDPASGDGGRDSEDGEGDHRVTRPHSASGPRDEGDGGETVGGVDDVGEDHNWVNIAQVEAELDKYKRKYDNLVRKLKDKVECPVCFEVPKQAPIHVCSNGHVICAKCYRVQCPTCRLRMLGATSLLAVTVIESIEHDCEWEDCTEKHTLETLNEHMAKCLHRQVECPYLECRKRLPVSRLLEHSLQCCVSEITQYELPHKFDFYINMEGFSINMDMLANRRGLHWKMKGIKYNDKIFMLRVAFEQTLKRWSFTLLMLGGENSCSNYSTDITVGSAKSDARYGKAYYGDVCPIDISTVDKALEKDLCLTLSDTAMMKIATETSSGKFSFTVSVNIIANN